VPKVPADQSAGQQGEQVQACGNQRSAARQATSRSKPQERGARPRQVAGQAVDERHLAAHAQLVPARQHGQLRAQRLLAHRAQLRGALARPRLACTASRRAQPHSIACGRTHAIKAHMHSCREHLLTLPGRHGPTVFRSAGAAFNRPCAYTPCGPGADPARGHTLGGGRHALARGLQALQVAQRAQLLLQVGLRHDALGGQLLRGMPGQRRRRQRTRCPARRLATSCQPPPSTEHKRQAQVQSQSAFTCTAVTPACTA